MFFHYSFATAPTLTGSQTATITVHENTPTGYNFPFSIATGQVNLYNSTSTTLLASGTDLGSGNVSFTVTAGMEASNGGNTFIDQVEYNVKSIVGVPTAQPIYDTHHAAGSSAVLAHVGPFHVDACPAAAAPHSKAQRQRLPLEAHARVAGIGDRSLGHAPAWWILAAARSEVPPHIAVSSRLLRGCGTPR